MRIKKVFLKAIWLSLVMICALISFNVQAEENRATTYTRLGVPRFHFDSDRPVFTEKQNEIVTNKAQEACKKIGFAKVVNIEIVPSSQKDIPEGFYLDFLKENNLRKYPKNHFFVAKVTCQDETDQDPSLLFSEDLDSSGDSSVSM